MNLTLQICVVIVLKVVRFAILAYVWNASTDIIYQTRIQVVKNAYKIVYNVRQ